MQKSGLSYVVLPCAFSTKKPRKLAMTVEHSPNIYNTVTGLQAWVLKQKTPKSNHSAQCSISSQRHVTLTLTHLTQSSMGETSRRSTKFARLSRVIIPTSRPALQT